jgi:1-acyl-sn-glycerol-3-phosphate acyltransferase
MYSVIKIRRHFKEINIIGKIEKKNLPVLLIANHISWWDGFWAVYLNQKIFKRRFHFMMLEDQLRKYWFFNYSGGYSVKKNSKSVIETLHYTSELLTEKNNIVLIFPQGEIQSMHRQKFSFEKGVEKIIGNQPNPVQIIFMVSLVDYFSSSKPGLYLYLKEFSLKESGIENMQQCYNDFYGECIEKQLTIKR